MFEGYFESQMVDIGEAFSQLQTLKLKPIWELISKKSFQTNKQWFDQY